LTSLNNARHLEELVLKFINDVGRREGRVRLITSYDLDSVIAGGMLFKYAELNDIYCEYLTLIDEVPGDNVPTITLGFTVRNLTNGLQIIKGSQLAINKLGAIQVIHTPTISPFILKVLEEVMVITNDLRYLTLTAVLSRYVPRLKAVKFNEFERSYINELVDMNLVKIIKGPKIFEYSVTSIDRALSKSFDIFVPEYSGRQVSKDVKSLSEDELIKEILSKIQLVSSFKVSANEVVGENYITMQEWFFNDLYECLYALMSVADTYGIEYVLSATIIRTYIPWIKLYYRSVFNDITENVYSIISEKNIQKVRGNLYKVTLKKLTPLTPISKVLKSLLIPDNALVIYEYLGGYYIPLLGLDADVVKTLKNTSERVGGLLKLRDVGVVPI